MLGERPAVTAICLRCRAVSVQLYAMCNLYSMTSNREAVRRLFKADRDSVGNLPLFSAIFPGHDAPVVRLDDDSERELVMMSWGFVLPQQGRVPKRVTNARADKVKISRFWRPSFEQRRCLVPVSSFAEPKGKQPAVWHWFGLKGDEPRPLFAFAGIWRPWKGELKGQEMAMDTFSFLTTTPNDVVRPIHPNRMPVILRPDDYETWLTGSPEGAMKLAAPFPANDMAIVNKGDKKDEPPVAA